MAYLANTKSIGLVIDDSHLRIVNIPSKVPFTDIISSNSHGIFGSIVLFYLSRFDGPNQDNEDNYPYDFPLKFSHQSGIFLLKTVICHFPGHWITYVRQGFNETFIEIDDSKLRSSPLNTTHSNLALYLKATQ
jgi:hypothetical protein